MPDFAPYFFTFHMLIYILLNARKHGTLKGQLSNLKTITIHTNHTHSDTHTDALTQLTFMSYLRCFVSILGFFRPPFCCWFSLKNNDNGERNCNNSCKTFCTILLGCISGGNSYPTIPFMVVPPPPFSPCTLFVLLGFCFRTKSLGSLCFLLARLWLANFPVFRWIYWGSRAYFFRLMGGRCGNAGCGAGLILLPCVFIVQLQ